MNLKLKIENNIDLNYIQEEYNTKLKIINREDSEWYYLEVLDLVYLKLFIDEEYEYAIDFYLYGKGDEEACIIEESSLKLILNKEERLERFLELYNLITTIFNNTLTIKKLIKSVPKLESNQYRKFKK